MTKPEDYDGHDKYTKAIHNKVCDFVEAIIYETKDPYWQCMALCMAIKIWHSNLSGSTCAGHHAQLGYGAIEMLVRMLADNATNPEFQLDGDGNKLSDILDAIKQLEDGETVQ